MSQSTLKLKRVRFLGDSLCSDPTLDVRAGNENIASATITQPNTPVSFGLGALAIIRDSWAIKASQNSSFEKKKLVGMDPDYRSLKLSHLSFNSIVFSFGRISCYLFNTVECMCNKKYPLGY